MRYVFLGASLIALWGCAQSQPESAYRPTATIKDIMNSFIDPSANDIWNSVAVTVDLEGVHESFPQTDDDWDAVHRSAVSLLEGTNLLLIPGRTVAEPGARSENPDTELEPSDIQELIDMDFDNWTQRAHRLHDVASQTLTSIEARDTAGFSESVNALDRACEGCHLDYWYPNDEAARQAYEESAPENEAPEP